MNLRAIGCNVASAPVELREKLAFDEAKLRFALAELTARYGVEAATRNRWRTASESACS